MYIFKSLSAAPRACKHVYNAKTKFEKPELLFIIFDCEQSVFAEIEKKMYSTRSNSN
jgi:hypothetical protein